jgi:sarcosine oxidase, subunit beta
MNDAERVAALGSADVRLPAEVDVAIVGGGIMGLAIAYHLARLTAWKIVVVERSYLVSGASGRNGGGVRMQWADAGNVRLMMESIELCRGLAQELGINLWFRQGGYLFLARTEAGERRLVRNAELHRELGASTRLLGPHEAHEIVPQLDIRDVRLAAYNPDDGVVFPWPFVWGYAAQAVRRGVVVRTHTEVEGIEPVAGERLELRLSTGETMVAQTVVNATGAWSAGLNRKLGIDLPNRPHRHEILSSEPLKPFLQPLVVDLTEGLYFSQSTRGEIVTGITMPHDHEEASTRIDLGSSLEFLTRIGRALCRILPIAASLQVLRQWSGPYDVSPDGDAIVGPTPGWPSLFQVCGFTGHGFMMGPAVGRLVARHLAGEARHPMLDRWDPARFARGPTQPHEDMIIG